MQPPLASRISKNRSKGLDEAAHDSSYGPQPFSLLSPQPEIQSTGHVQSYIAYVFLYVCFVCSCQMKNGLAKALNQSDQLLGPVRRRALPTGDQMISTWLTMSQNGHALRHVSVLIL